MQPDPVQDECITEPAVGGIDHVSLLKQELASAKNRLADERFPVPSMPPAALVGGRNETISPGKSLICPQRARQTEDAEPMMPIAVWPNR